MMIDQSTVWNEEKEKLGREIILDLYKNGMIKTWYRNNPQGWTLVSGIWSPFYIQLRPLPSYPGLLKKIGYALDRLIKEDCNNINKIIGIAMTGIPIAVAISFSENIPSCYTRKLENVRTAEDFNSFINTYGEHSMIEGELNNGDVIGVVDDLVTKFDSKLVAIKQVDLEVKVRKLKDIVCSDVIVLLDREQGADKIAKKYGITLHCLIPFMSKGIKWLKDGLTDYEYEVIKDYLVNYKKYQNADLQKKLYMIAMNKKIKFE